MPDAILALRFEGPLQSWGTRARWDVRDTATEPTKSGVVGLLGAALGLERGDRRLADELHAGLRMAVRIEREGTRLVDYHTVTDFLPVADGRFRYNDATIGRSVAALREKAGAEPSTIQSSRHYLEDAAFLVLLARRATAPAELLERLATAVQAPCWPLFLGRKACPPTRPVFDALTRDYLSLEEALVGYPSSMKEHSVSVQVRAVLEGPPSPRAETHVVWTGTGIEADRDDGPILGDARLFASRRVRETVLTLGATAAVGGVA